MLWLRRSGATGLAAGGVVQDVHVHRLPRQLHIAHHAASDEAVAHALHVRKARLVHHVRVLELNVQVLAARRSNQRQLALHAQRAGDGRTWSTECSVPTMARSFFSSTVICLPTSVLKKLANSMVRAQAQQGVGRRRANCGLYRHAARRGAARATYAGDGPTQALDG